MLSNAYQFSSRWLFSTNHKDIGILYLIFGAFSGVLLQCQFSFVWNCLNLEVKFLMGNHPYNVLVTGHAFMMIYGYAYTYWCFGNVFVPLILVLQIWPSQNE